MSTCFGHSGADAVLPVVAHDEDAAVTGFVDAVVREATTPVMHRIVRSWP